MKKLRAGLLGFLSLLSFNALAIGWGTNTTITGYYAWASGTAYIKVANMQNIDSCTNPGYLALDTTQSNFKYIWAQIMAAQAANQTVNVYYNGCNGSYPSISAIAIPAIW